jgi:hypothetical protein
VRAIGLRLAAALTLAGVALLATCPEAGAHSRVFFGFNFGFPYFWGPGYFYRPPVVYLPPPVYYAPPRVVVRSCRDYHGDAIVDATGERFHGRACLMSDGRWHIVERY